VDDGKNFQTTAKVYREFFKEGDEPACVPVVVDWIPGGSHVEVTCIATTNLATRKVVRPASFVPDRVLLRHSPGVWAGNTLYLSGLMGFQDASGAVVGLEKQFHEMAKSHLGALDAAGLKLEDIVSGNVYLADIEEYQPMNAIYREYFSKGPGVRTTLMPSKARATNEVRVTASFIAAKTQPAK
jgi:enamine deaminase RidA (YjgF/YER057c/UK114 family)